MTRTSLALCAFFAVLGCQDTSPLFECELSYPDGKEEPPWLECPRQAPVRLDRTVEEGTTCVYEANVHTILCDDGTRFDAETGQFLEESVLEQDQGDMQEEDGAGEPDDMGGDMRFPGEGALLGGESARGLYTHGSCSVLGNAVVCTDGLTATLPNVLDPLAIMCETRLLRGYGRRIICQDKDDDLAVIVPDGESEAVPMCEAQSHVVHCEDGTTFGAGGSGLETSGGEAIEACENPRLVQDAPPEVVARCMESIQDCEACTLTSSCERALTPVLLCSGEEVIEVIDGDTCYPADGVYTIASRQEADVLKERACTVIVGDVLFDTGDDLDAPAVDVLWLDALSSTTSIQGSLFIKNADVRDQDVIAYDELLQALVLESVGGDVSWEGQRGINYLDWPAVWTHIGGQLRIASWNVLQRIVLPPPTEDDVTRFIGADWAIQGNPQLEEFDVAYTEVRGSLVLAENMMFQGCSLYRAIQWAYGWASGVVLITATFGEPPESCIINR